MTLQDTVRAVRVGLERIGFADPNFRSSRWIRLRVLEEHIQSSRLLQKNSIHGWRQTAARSDRTRAQVATTVP